MTAGGPALVQTMRAHGGYCGLVSGGFTLFTSAIAARIGFDENRGILWSSKMGGSPAASENRFSAATRSSRTLLELRERLGIAAAETMAIGDGANDLGMIGEAGLGVAFHAKPAVAVAAHARIDHADLTALLSHRAITERISFTN